MEQERKKRSNKQKNRISNIILVIAILVFFYSAYQLLTTFTEYYKGEKEYDDIVKEVVEITPQKEETEEEETKQEEKAGEETEEPVVHQSLQVDFKKLFKINSETAGWIQFDRPKQISYPIVLTTDNSKYLTTTFEGKNNTSGAIFMDANNSMDFMDRNTFIYGHNMKNGSMFGQLRKYKSKDYWEKSPYFYIYTTDGREIQYQIFAVSIVEDTSRSYTSYFEGDEAFAEYLKYLQKTSRYKTGVEVNAQSKIVSLSTCTNVTVTQRLLVHGVKIAEK